MQRTVGRHIWSLDENALHHLDRVLCRSYNGWSGNGQWRWRRGGYAWTRRCAVNTTRKCPPPPTWLEGWFGRFKLRARLTRGLKTEAGARQFMGLMARGMA